MNITDIANREYLRLKSTSEQSPVLSLLIPEISSIELQSVLVALFEKIEELEKKIEKLDVDLDKEFTQEDLDSVEPALKSKVKVKPGIKEARRREIKNAKNR